MADIDQKLLDRTDELIRQFDAAINKLTNPPDLRAFFTYAHGYITRKIRKHIKLFNAPNPLLRLNDSFATTFLKAINGAPHDGWQRAFRVCSGLAKAENEGFVGAVFIGPISYETCAGCMAKIHISRDLMEALRQESGIDAQDYGNVLVFVMEGHLYAEKMIHGAALGALMVMLSVVPMEKLKMSAKLWRNQAFEEVYHKPVPDPDPAFLAAYHKGEGR